MEGISFFTLHENLMIEQIIQQDHRVIVLVKSTVPTSCCPLCASTSENVHSYYLRTLSDLPSSGFAVLLKLTVRRFFCRNPRCARRIFTERLADLVEPWAQMTNQLRKALCGLSFATSAEVGSRLASRLGMKRSASTLLRCQRATRLPDPEPCKKIGLDDFADPSRSHLRDTHCEPADPLPHRGLARPDRRNGRSLARCPL
jgi:transposase